MTIVLVFIIFYLMATIWDVIHVNEMVGTLVTTGHAKPRRSAPPVPPAPRLVIELPATRASAGSPSSVPSPNGRASG